jgi:hypothetical protein
MVAAVQETPGKQRHKAYPGILQPNAGVQRTTINLVEKSLQNAGLIQIGRGRISILDPDGLHAVACDCYGRIERRYEELLGPLD